MKGSEFIILGGLTARARLGGYLQGKIYSLKCHCNTINESEHLHSPLVFAACAIT